VSAFPPDDVRAHLLALGCDPSRVEESFTHSSGAGGQNVNKVATCVELRYAPRNVQVKMQEHRTQAANRMAAWKLLARLLQRQRDDQSQARRRISAEDPTPTFPTGP
jgi:protein subunit release factor B